MIGVSDILPHLYEVGEYVTFCIMKVRLKNRSAKRLGNCIGYTCLCPSKNVTENTVTLGSNDDLFTDTVYGKEVNWVSIAYPKEPLRVKARVRYNQKEQSATLYPFENNCVKLIFDNPQRAVTSGQAVVFYDGDILLGGGTIFQPK